MYIYIYIYDGHAACNQGWQLEIIKGKNIVMWYLFGVERSLEKLVMVFIGVIEDIEELNN